MNTIIKITYFIIVSHILSSTCEPILLHDTRTTETVEHTLDNNCFVNRVDNTKIDFTDKTFYEVIGIIAQKTTAAVKGLHLNTDSTMLQVSDTC
ncbi:hypothetical protein ACF0H5_006839 [Mactra antiquata]